jgi:hypothetical protein
MATRSRHGSEGRSLASHRGGTGSKQSSLRGIYGVLSGMLTRFFRHTSVFLVSMTSSILETCISFI